jgi:hypothetical protein
MGLLDRPTTTPELILGMLGEDSKLIATARRVSAVAPVLGGVAVFLHGYRRTTADVDVFADDSERVASALMELGATWDETRREHTLGGIPVHIVTVRETGDEPTRISEIEGVRVVGLADLIRYKLRSGLRSVARAKDLADVVELIKAIPLDKSFAGKLPTELRNEFKQLVESIENDRA